MVGGIWCGEWVEPYARKYVRELELARVMGAFYRHRTARVLSCLTK